MCWYHVVDVTVWWVHYSEIPQLFLSDHLQYHAGLLQRHEIKNIKHLFIPPPPATPCHPLLQARCEIFTKLTRLIIIEVFVSRPVRPVMTDSAEHCPTHLSHLRPPGVATGWRYHLRPSRVLSWQFKSVLYPLNVNIITDIPRQQYLSLLWECLSQIVWVSEERNLCSGKINCSSRFLLFLYILLNLCKNNGRKISRKKE